MKTRRRLVWTVAGLAFAVFVAYRLLAPGAALEVETAAVRRDTLRVAVAEEGRTRVRDAFVVAAPITGRLARIGLDAGAQGEAGTPLARLYPAPQDPSGVGATRAQVQAAQARRREAEARVEEAEARARQLEREAARSSALVQDSVLSQQEAERDVLAATTARQQVAAARAAARAAEADVAALQAALAGASAPAGGGEAVVVRAPGAGRVLRVLEKSERVVPAGTPLVEIGDAGGLEAVVDVLTEDAVAIRPGNPVLFQAWGGSPFRGTVRLVEPAAFTKVSALGVEEQRVNVIVALDQPPAALGAGYRVEAQIVTWTGTGVLTVPTGALFQQEGAWYAFAVEGGRAVRRRLRLGHRSAQAAEVVEGLNEGDEVILFPTDEVADGTRVQGRRAADAAP